MNKSNILFHSCMLRPEQLKYNSFDLFQRFSPLVIHGWRNTFWALINTVPSNLSTTCTRLLFSHHIQSCVLAWLQETHFFLHEHNQRTWNRNASMQDPHSRNSHRSLSLIKYTLYYIHVVYDRISSICVPQYGRFSPFSMQQVRAVGGQKPILETSGIQV